MGTERLTGDAKWIARIQNTTIERFCKRLGSDITVEAERDPLKRTKYDLDSDEIEYHWKAKGVLAVSLSVGQYTADSVTIVLERRTPFQTLKPVIEQSLQEWVRDGQPGATIAGGQVYRIPWTEADEVAVIHGRALTTLLLDWLVERFGAQFTSVPSNELLAVWEDMELVSPVDFAYRTHEGRKFWEKRNRKSAIPTEQGGQEIEALPIPEGSTQTDKRKGGRKRLQAHKNAIRRLEEDKQTREQNFYQWKQEYQEETAVDPEQTQSGASELYRARVWRVYQRKNRTDETPKSTG